MTYGDCTFFNHPIFPTVFQDFYTSIFNTSPHDVSYVWKGLGEHKSLLRKNMNESFHKKGRRNPCTAIIA